MPMTPAPEEVFTIAPPPCLRISGISCFMQRNTPRRLMSMIRFHSSSSYSAVGAGFLGSIPALLKAKSSLESLNCLGHRLLYILGPRHVTPNRHCARALFFYQAGRFLVV